MATVAIVIASETDSVPASPKSVAIAKTLTGRIRDPISKILGEVLKDNSIGVTPTTGISGGTGGNLGDWPIYIANAPNAPDNILTVFDTEGVKQGRIMLGGMTVKHPGFQVQIRCNDYLIGWDKANAVMVSLSEKVENKTVVIIGNTYIIYAISITSGPISLGKNVTESKRYIFTVNGTVSLLKRT
jgi:hypothetical protein